MWPQRAVTVAGVGTSESGVGTSKAVRAVLFSSLTQVLIFSNVIMPSTTTPPTFTLQLSLELLFLHLTFSLFLVHFFLEMKDLIFFIPGRMAQFVSGPSDCWPEDECLA